jgi:hypothetical protein
VVREVLRDPTLDLPAHVHDASRLEKHSLDILWHLADAAAG